MLFVQNVHSANVGGSTVLLDLKQNCYFSLDDIGSKVWRSLSASPTDRATLLSHFDSRMHQQVDRFLDDALELGVLGLEKPSDSVTNRVYRGPSSAMFGRWVLALRIIRWVSRVLEKYDFDEALARITCMLFSHNPPTTDLDRAVSAFLFAENFFTHNNEPDDCLPRSLALWLFLNSVGVECEHRIGIKRYPRLMAHAWVETQSCDNILDNCEKSEYSLLMCSKPNYE